MSDLAELFARDPRSYSDADLDELIAKYREARKSFKLGNMTAGKVPSAKQQAALELASRLDLGEFKL